jgi:hypothetical protein
MEEEEQSTTAEKRKKRLDICNGCEYFFKHTKTCKQCMCFMPVKASLKNSRCPLYKW